MCLFFSTSSYVNANNCEEIKIYAPDVFEDQTPNFHLHFSKCSPLRIWWQIFSSRGGCADLPIFEEINKYRENIYLSEKMFSIFQNECPYAFRIKYETEEGWSDWSSQHPFYILKTNENDLCIHQLLASRSKSSPHSSGEKVLKNGNSCLIPEEHPMKGHLDRIFSENRVTFTMKSLKLAGFKASRPRKFTKIIVASHPDYPEYIFKLFVDAQRYEKRISVYEYWALRIQGARLIQEEIDKNGWQHLFKVPVKYLYPLPKDPSCSSDFYSKDYLLVEDNMNIYPDSENNAIWKSDQVSQEHLSHLFTLVKTLGLSDSVKPANVPFSRDGKIAFVDTQAFHRKVDFKHFKPFLSKKNREYWNQLIQD